MKKLIKDAEDALKNLRQALLDRGMTTAISITYYGDNINSPEQIYLIGTYPKELTNPLKYHTFKTFIKELFLFPTIEENIKFHKSFYKRNQKIIDNICNIKNE